MFSLLNTLLVVLALLGRASASQYPLLAESAASPHSSDFSKYIQKVGETFHAPGISLAVVRTSHEPQFFNWGRRDEDGKPPTEHTLFPLASASKNFAAISLGILMDDFKYGRNVTALPPGVELSWTTKLAALLPGEWELQDSYASGYANVLDILSHVTGLPRHDFSIRLDTPLPKLVSQLRHLRPKYELRERYEYGSLMYAVTAYVISKYSNQSYSSFVKDRILSPLGMSSTTLHPEEAYKSGNAAQLWVREAGRARNETRVVPWYLTEGGVDGPVAGPAGVISNSQDLVRPMLL